MEELGTVKSIWVYPIKSLDGIIIDQASFNRTGGLENDRLFSLKDFSGNYINAKNYPEIIKIRTNYNLTEKEVTLSYQNNNSSFNLENDKRLFEEWFSDYLSKKVKLHRNEEIGFPDDRKRPGPTVYSYQSLNLVHTWFPSLSVDELRRRFRGNIELDGDQDGFWEDNLLSTAFKPGIFNIDTIEFHAVKPCPRCPVPSRNSLDSQMYSGFQKRFTEERKKHVKDNLDKKLFPHYYMFALNTQVFNFEDNTIQKGHKVILS